jgi:hypothetical protein
MVLVCFVFQLSWVRRRDWHILTHGNKMFTQVTKTFWENHLLVEKPVVNFTNLRAQIPKVQKDTNDLG